MDLVEVFGIKHFDAIAVVSILLILEIVEALIGTFKRSKRTFQDYISELVSFSQLTILIQPGIILLVSWLGLKVFPELENRYVGVNPWLQFGVFLLIEDMPQYWWHRLAHHSPKLWKLHLTHHASPDMGVGTAWRNGALYYALMPNIWLASVAIYLGFAKIYIVYTVVKLLIVMAAHSEVRWDSVFYKYKILHPIAWILEHTISTPATHFAHHGLTNADGISNNNGNFGNMLFIWDQLFGTAKITRKYPTKFGIEHDPHDPWYVMLYYPFIKSAKKDSELK